MVLDKFLASLVGNNGGDGGDHWSKNNINVVAGYVSIICVNLFVCNMYIYIYIHIYVTGFWKTDQIVTLGLFHFIGPANSYTCTLHIHSAITRLG